MITIRAAQLDAFAQARFRDWLVQHVHAHFPEQCASLGREEVCRWLDLALVGARAYRFASEAEVAQYVNLVFLLGPDFAGADGLHGAADLLASAEPAAARLQRLTALAEAQVFGARASRESA